MRATLVDVRGVWKKFCRDLSRSLRGGARDAAREFFGVAGPEGHLGRGEFWAIRDVSLSLGQGESLAVLGHNGAGKSTLVKLLIGRLKPNLGSIRTRGRIVAVTEMGLGFNPVLSGRENIFLNAAVHGLGRRDSLRLAGQVADFTEMGEFLDSPLQTYSSAMRARLGFAVASHLNADVRIIDEVLAVGDPGFRRKCLDQVRASLGRGESLLLVSHDRWSVEQLCQRSVVLDQGLVVHQGSTSVGIEIYFDRQQGADEPRRPVGAALAACRTPSSAAPEVRQSLSLPVPIQELGDTYWPSEMELAGRGPSGGIT